MLHTQLQNKELKKAIIKQKVGAINEGNSARCGGTRNGKACNHKLGEFEMASGTIKCIRCGAINVVKR